MENRKVLEEQGKLLNEIDRLVRKKNMNHIKRELILLLDEVREHINQRKVID